MDFRQKLLDVHGEAEFKGILLKHAQDLASEQSNPTRRMGNHEPEAEFEVSVLFIVVAKPYVNFFVFVFCFSFQFRTQTHRSQDAFLHKDYMMI